MGSTVVAAGVGDMSIAGGAGVYPKGIRRVVGVVLRRVSAAAAAAVSAHHQSTARNSGQRGGRTLVVVVLQLTIICLARIVLQN